MSGSGWFRRQPTLPTAGGAPAAKRIWQRTKASGVPRPTKKRAVVLTATSAVLVLGAGVTIVAFASPGSHASLVSSDAPVVAHKPLQPAAGLQLVSMSPIAGTRGVNGTSPIRVQFSAPLAASSPMPTLSPSIPGNWTVQGDDAVFTPTVGYLENTKVTVKIPGGLDGMISAAGAKVGDGGTLGSGPEPGLHDRLVQHHAPAAAARPARLPAVHLDVHVSTGDQPGQRQGRALRRLQRARRDLQLAGQLSVEPDEPVEGRSDNMLEVGAIRAFESVHGLTMDGTAGRTVWSDLLTAVTQGKHNPNGYTYALASQNSPENLRIWHNGSLVFSSPRTPASRRPPRRTAPSRFTCGTTSRSCRAPTRTEASTPIPVYYVSYFNGGDAVHYFPRGSYGWYQSLGCVELPWDAAKQAWPYLTYGSLVTVTGPVA